MMRTRLRGAGLPVLELWDVTDDPIDICVGIDHRAVGQAMGAQLVRLGYRRPAYVGIPPGRDLRAEKRLAGLTAAFAAADIAVTDIRVDAAPSFEAGRDGTKTVLAQALRPDVLYYLNDHLAFGGLMACEAAGVDVPGEIGIAGFNGLNINNVLPRQLTTSVTPRALMGRTAARTLVAAIRGVRTERHVAMPVPIEHGATTRSRLTARDPAA